MSRLRVHGFTISVDGYGAGPRQSVDEPLGVGGEELHEWMVGTRAFKQMQGGGEGGSTGVEDDFVTRGTAGIGAWILGRNMFGTEFRFVTDGIQSALDQAKDAAGGQDVRLGGGASTIRQYLTAGLVDEMHFAIAPRLLGSGEHLLAGLDLPALGYTCSQHVTGGIAAHFILTRRE
jgi:dihydrofolate reductase